MITKELTFNFDKRNLRGCDFDVLPFFRIFPPKKYKGWHKGWTFHFGWLVWTVIIHTFKEK